MSVPKLEPTTVPPHEPLCHCQLSLPPTDVKVVLEPSQMLVVPVMEVDAVGSKILMAPETLLVAEPAELVTEQ